MIGPKRSVAGDTFTADGDRFDLDRVLAAMLGFVRGFVGALLSEDPALLPVLRISGAASTARPFDAEFEPRLRHETSILARRHDVMTLKASVDAHPFRLKLYPLGADHLFRRGREAPRTLIEEPWQELDPTPVIEFWPLGRHSPLTLFERSFLRSVTERSSPEGTHLILGRIPALRFSHAAFGRGRGPLRICLVNASVR